MNKPVFRWTVGSCGPNSLDLLEESVHRLRLIYKEIFQYFIYYNGVTDDERNRIEKISQQHGIRPVKQDWKWCPIDNNEKFATPRNEQGDLQPDGKYCGGTLWKVCPARANMGVHEIVMDNDIIFRKPLPQINKFLSSRRFGLQLQEPIRFYGRYDSYLPEGPPYLNSGFFGLPPGYDFGSEIHKTWKRLDAHEELTHADEQGLLMRTLLDIPTIKVAPNDIVEYLAADYQAKPFHGYAYHFAQANRLTNHYWWNKYKKKLK